MADIKAPPIKKYSKDLQIKDIFKNLLLTKLLNLKEAKV